MIRRRPGEMRSLVLSEIREYSRTTGMMPSAAVLRSLLLDKHEIAISRMTLHRHLQELHSRGQIAAGKEKPAIPSGAEGRLIVKLAQILSDPSCDPSVVAESVGLPRWSGPIIRNLVKFT